MSDAYALCAKHGCQLVTPTMRPFCPKCRGEQGGKRRSPKQQASAVKTLEQHRHKRWPKTH